MAEATRALSTSLGKRRGITTDAKTIAVLLKPLIDLHGEPKNWATAAPLYIEALADVPAELLAKAVRHAITSNPFFPKPADLRLSIVEELQDHRHRQEQRRLAMLPKPKDREPNKPEDVVYVHELIRKTFGDVRERSKVIYDE